MAMMRSNWLDDMPTPWDMDCRGKFCIHEFKFNQDDYKYRGIDGKFNVFTTIRQEMAEKGKLEFLTNNGINFFDSAKFTAVNNIHLYQATIAVLVDMPQEVRTLYKLTFAE